MRQIWNKVKTRRKGDKIITMQKKALQVSHILILNICFSSSLLISTCGHEVRLHCIAADCSGFEYLQKLFYSLGFDYFLAGFGVIDIFYMLVENHSSKAFNVSFSLSNELTDIFG